MKKTLFFLALTCMHVSIWLVPEQSLAAFKPSTEDRKKLFKIQAKGGVPPISFKEISQIKTGQTLEYDVKIFGDIVQFFPTYVVDQKNFQYYIVEKYYKTTIRLSSGENPEWYVKYTIGKKCDDIDQEIKEISSIFPFLKRYKIYSFAFCDNFNYYANFEKGFFAIDAKEQAVFEILKYKKQKPTKNTKKIPIFTIRLAFAVPKINAITYFRDPNFPALVLTYVGTTSKKKSQKNQTKKSRTSGILVMQSLAKIKKNGEPLSLVEFIEYQKPFGIKKIDFNLNKERIMYWRLKE